MNPRDLHTIFVDLRIGLDGDELSLQKLNVSGDVFFGPAYQCAGETVFETAVVDLYGVLDQGGLLERCRVQRRLRSEPVCTAD